ncbi:MAG: hypothetical protein ACREU3_17865 [Steroidobacteraceae bacterium]
MSVALPLLVGGGVVGGGVVGGGDAGGGDAGGGDVGGGAAGGGAAGEGAADAGADAVESWLLDVLAGGGALEPYLQPDRSSPASAMPQKAFSDPIDISPPGWASGML